MTVLSCRSPTRPRRRAGKTRIVNKIWDFIEENPIAAVVAGGEIAFWVAIAAGLVARYLLKLRRTSVVLLLLTPVIDLVVLAGTVIDLRDGAKANFVHGLAAVYLGFSVVFGHSMIKWADVRFAHRFAGGPPPHKPDGREKLRAEWRDWGKCVAACALAAVVLLGLIFLVGDTERVAPLWGWLPRLGVVTAIWFATGPLWQQLTPRHDRAEGAHHRMRREESALHRVRRGEGPLQPGPGSDPEDVHRPEGARR